MTNLNPSTTRLYSLVVGSIYSTHTFTCPPIIAELMCIYVRAHLLRGRSLSRLYLFKWLQSKKKVIRCHKVKA